MDGVHDLGGMHGFGPVEPEADEPVFHADWERRALAVTLATGALGRWSIDRSRFTREQLPPAVYLSSSYYEIWIRGLERLLVEAGLLAPADLTDQARADLPDGTEVPARDRPSPAAEAVPWSALRAGLDRGTPYDRDVATTPAFAAGDAVRTRNDHPRGHTRVPRYARGRVGRVVAVRGPFVAAERNAVPAGTPSPGEADWLYTVEFDATALWGADADPTGTVAIDAWQHSLEPAP